MQTSCQQKSPDSVNPTQSKYSPLPILRINKTTIPKNKDLYRLKEKLKRFNTSIIISILKIWRI
jgi:hypothetical protein